MDWCVSTFLFPNCCIHYLFESDLKESEVVAIEINDTQSLRNECVFTSPRKSPYLYDDPEMELWFQKHCRTWGFQERYRTKN